MAAQTSFSQHVSKNNYTGAWESASSWDPEWVSPIRDSVNVDITINGYIITSGSVSFSLTPVTLTVNDTLVIKGDLFLGNRANLVINDNGILIIKGALTISNKTNIVANNYLIVATNLIKSGSQIQGSAISNDNPVKVFIGGSVAASVTNNSLYPILYNEPPLPTSPYDNSSGCFGNLTDLISDPIWAFYSDATCTAKKVTAGDPVCPGGTVMLHAEGGNTYSWTGPGGFTSDLKEPALLDVKATDGGTYTCIISETGCGQQSKTVDVVVKQEPIISLKYPERVCAGSVINLAASGGSNYIWTGPNGFKSSVPEPVINESSPDMSGAYSVKVTGENNCSAIASAQVSVTDLPVISIASNSPLCEGSTLKLSSSGTGSFRWTGPEGFTSSEQNPVLEKTGITNAGTYKVIVKNQENCSSEASVNVIISKNPQPSAMVTAPVCEESTIRLSASGGSFYTWTGPEGFSSIEREPVIINASTSRSGTYEVTVTTPDNCSAQATVQVMVNPLPNVSFLLPERICNDDELVLTGVPAGGAFSVKNGPGLIKENVLKVTGTGDVTIEYVYTDVCPNKSDRSITVLDRPRSDPGPDQRLEYVFETFMSAELLPAIMGKWTVVSGSGIFENPASPVSRVTALSAGENIFRWTVANGSCEESSEIKVFVNELFVPSVFTPNSDGRNDLFIINAITDNTTLTVFNRWGTLEYRNNHYRNDWDGRNLSGNELPEDTYFYILDLGKGILRKGAVIIVR